MAASRGSFLVGRGPRSETAGARAARGRRAAEATRAAETAPAAGTGHPRWGAALPPGLEELDLLGPEPRQELALHRVEHGAHARHRLPRDRVELRATRA